MSFKNSFEKLSKREKIQLYLLPFVIGFLLWVNIFQNNENYQDEQLSKEIVKYKEKINSYQTTSQKPSKITIFQYLETVATKLDIEIESIKFDKNRAIIKYSGNLQNSINFLELIEENFKLYSINLNYQEKVLFNEAILSEENFFGQDIENSKLTQNIPNPFMKKIEPKNEIIANDNNKSVAVFGEYLFFENNLYKKGDTYNGSEIIEVLLNGFKIKKDEKIIFVEVLSED